MRKRPIREDEIYVARHGPWGSLFKLCSNYTEQLFVPTRKAIWCLTLQFWDTPLQKSRRNHRYFVSTEALSGMVFVPAQKLSGIIWTPIRYVTLHFRDRRSTASHRYRNRTEITAILCQQKPYPVWFSCRRKSCPVLYEHLSDMWLSTLEIGAAQLRTVTEIAPKSPFLCVNRSPIRYGFRAGAKAVRYYMNTSPICNAPL